MRSPLTLEEVIAKSAQNREARTVNLGSAGQKHIGRPRNESPSTAHLGKPKRIKRAPTPLEHDEQVMLINWWRGACSGLGVDERLLFSIPNGSHKSMAAAIRFKAEGLRSGVPDLLLAVAMLRKNAGGLLPDSMHAAGLFIEMKRIGGKVEPEQSEYHDLLRSQGYQVSVCFGFEAARSVITQYLGRA